MTTSVCTGAFLLGAAGLLDGLRATTHWTTIDCLGSHYAGIEILADVRFVDEGAHHHLRRHLRRYRHEPCTSSARLHGDEVARRTARDMEYDGGDG